MYLIKGQSYKEDPALKLGGGSEGTVYGFPGNKDACVKIFHPTDPGDRAGAYVAAYRAKKIKAICKMGLSLPEQFTLPYEPAFDQKGGVIGFKMRRVPAGFHKLMKLLQPAFRTGNRIGLKEVALLYASLLEDLDLIHGKDLVVGDINTGCLMFNTDLDRAWVDTDSWSYPGFPCLATTEMFAHPDLYPNLVQGEQHVPPKPHHDRFSFLVALTMMMLPGAHPFRMGNHSTVKGLQNRANAGLTIFDPEVEYPKVLREIAPPETLSDDLLNEIIQRLKRRDNTPLDPERLRTFADAVVSCESCGVDYHVSRPSCPKCQQKTTVDMSTLTEMLIQEIFQISGTLLFAQVLDEILNLVCRTKTGVRIIRLDDHGKKQMIQTMLPDIRGARYRFFADYLTVCPDPYAPAPARIDLYKIDGVVLRPFTGTTTGVLENEDAIYGTSSRFLYRTAGNALIRSEVFGRGDMLVDSQIAQVHRNQSWFVVDRMSGADREALLGYDRAQRDWKWFVIRGESNGQNFHYHDIGVLPMRSGESLEDFTIYFANSSVLLVRKTLHQGREYIRYSIITLDGNVLADELLSSQDEGYECWESLHGKLFQGTSVLHVTPNGVVKQTFDKGTYTPLKDTKGLVTVGDHLVRFGQLVGIIRQGAVLTLTKKPRR